MNAKFEDLLVSPEFMMDPYPVLHSLREWEPVYWSDGIGGWLLTRYDDVMASFQNTAHFSNENRLGKTVNYLPPEKQANYKAVVDHYAAKGLIHSDPPDHTRLRGLVTQEFTSKVVEQMRPRIQQVVDELLDAVEDNGKMDVVADFASALPVGVIAEILGVPPSDRHLMRKWADLILSFQGVNKPSEEDLSRAQEGLVEIRAYLEDMIDERRRQPRQDLISKFVAVQSAGERLSEAELMSTCVTLIIAGHETTISAIANTIYTLLNNPDQLRLLQQNPRLLEPTIEESLRYECPVSRQARLLTAEAVLGGKKLKQGEIVFQMLNAANRDPAHFPDPDRFDIRRERNRHIAFGYGVHFCVGALLARTEAFVAVRTAIKRLPNLRLVDNKPDWDLGKRTTRSLNSLLVRF